MKKKIFLVVYFLFVIFFCKNSCNAVSENFKFVIDTIGIPQFNVYGEEINEEIYYTYNIFAYSGPLAVYSKTSTQRFKSVPDYGKWTENGGTYKGTGNRGEYYVLGTSYSGSLINNVYFPVDAMPETTPDNWNYISFSGAYESWSDKSNYKYNEQLEFMKNNNLLFDQLDYTNNTSNSYNLVEYAVNPIKVGLDKMMLNTSSTWKTMGIITAKRRNSKGQIRNAIFASKPIAASADVKSNLSLQDSFVLTEDEENINIPIAFGASAINLNNYANEKHIKEICSIIYIDGQEYARVSGSKTVSVDKNINFTVSRNEYNIPNDYTLNIKVLSYLYTEFSVDGLMQNTLEKNITIKIQEKRIVPIKKSELKILKKENNSMVVSPLVQTLITQNSSSTGFVEAGRNLALNLNLDINKEDISSTDIYLNNIKQDYELLKEEDNKIIISLNLPKNLENTLASWNYLRNKLNNYLDINFNSIGERVKAPNTLKVVLKINDKEYYYEIKFDTIDEYGINMGYQFDNLVINKDEIDKNILINSW